MCPCHALQEYLSDSVCNLSTEEAVQVSFALYQVAWSAGLACIFI